METKAKKAKNTKKGIQLSWRKIIGSVKGCDYYMIGSKQIKSYKTFTSKECIEKGKQLRDKQYISLIKSAQISAQNSQPTESIFVLGTWSLIILIYRTETALQKIFEVVTLSLKSKLIKEDQHSQKKIAFISCFKHLSIH